MNDRELDLALRAMGRDRTVVAEPPALRERVAAIPRSAGGAAPWLPVPIPGQHALWSTAKYIVAVSVVALFGGFLLLGFLTAPQGDEVLPATATGSPTPSATEEPSFPTGTFVADEDGLTLEFRPDGTCERAGVPCTFGVIGNLFVEMAFDDPTGAQVPATYGWDFDGERLVFEPSGIDKRPDREAAYLDHTFRALGETQPLPDIPTDFPTGGFVPVDTRTDTTWFAEDGSFRGQVRGKYVVNGNLWTDAQNDSTIVEPIPGTYYWDWDGTELSFELWGEDDNVFRSNYFDGPLVRSDPVLAGRILVLSHPQLDVWARVEVVEREDGGFSATATVDEEPLGEGDGDTLQEALEAALEPLGEPYASDMAASVKN